MVESGGKHFVTYGTGLGVGTVSCCARSVTESSFALIVTYGAVAVFGTSGIYPIVTGRSHCSLCFDNLLTCGY